MVVTRLWCTAGVSLLISPDDPGRPDVFALLTEHLADMRATSPAESVHALDPDSLRSPEITFLSARRDGLLLGCGAVWMLDDTDAELKSMRTAAAARRTGVAVALVQALVDLARDSGRRQVFLETGTQDYFAPARSLYERCGFTPCGPFGNYRTDPHSAFYVLEL